MDSARTAWAEGTGLDAETIEALTLISEEAFRRAKGARRMRPHGDCADCVQEDVDICVECGCCQVCGACGCVALPYLPPGDAWNAWAPELDSFGYKDLADRVRALDY